MKKISFHNKIKQALNDQMSLQANACNQFGWMMHKQKMYACVSMHRILELTGLVVGYLSWDNFISQVLVFEFSFFNHLWKPSFCNIIISEKGSAESGQMASYETHASGFYSATLFYLLRESGSGLAQLMCAQRNQSLSSAVFQWQ